MSGATRPATRRHDPQPAVFSNTIGRGAIQKFCKL